MVVYGNDEGLEYDLRLDFSGAQSVRRDANGDLLIHVAGTELRMMRPAIYEEAPSGARKRVKGDYVLENGGSVGFRIGARSANSTLVIDPSLSVAYATFLGGSGSDAANSIARDSAGNIYVGGTTNSAATFPEVGAQAIGPAGNATDFFIAKINPSASGASSLMYLTFLGGSGNETGGLLAIDSTGDVAITGTTTSSDFPVTDASVLANGPNSTAVSEINQAGNSLLFSTLFGGNGKQSQFTTGGLALGPTGNIFVAADTSSSNLPVTAGAFQATLTGNVVDGFLAVFQPGAGLIYSTYLGVGANQEMGVGGVAVDGAGNAFLAGFTSNFAGAPFPAKNAFQSASAGGPFDAYLMKISPLGQGVSDLVYATLLGGSGSDEALAVAVDAQNPPDAYVAGTTQSSNFPVSAASGGASAAYQSSLHANATANAFFTVVAQNPSSGLTSIVYSTYLGGSVADIGQSIAVVATPNQVTVSNAVYIAGVAGSWDFPWHDNLQPFNGASDAFVAKLNPALSGSASLIYATPLGGTSPVGGTSVASVNGIATDSAGHVYVAGETTAADFPTARSPGTGFQTICGSCQQLPTVADAFAVAINENSAPEPSVYFSVRNVTFQPAPVGTINVPQFVAVVNGGESPLHIFSLNVIGPNAADFSLIAPAGCTASPINPGAFCSFEVGFDPSVSMPEGATISISDDAPGNPQALELVGQGGPGSQPLAVPVPSSYDFGSVAIGQTSAPATITLLNKGIGLLQIASVTLAGASKSQFDATFPANTCAADASVPASGSCTLSVTFSSAAPGEFHAEIDFVDNSGGVPGATQVLLLSANATLPAAETTSPASLNFGSEVAGTSSGLQIISLQSTGTAALSLTGIGITGSNAADFRIVSAGVIPCPMGSATVVSGATCTVGVAFSPQTTGAKVAAVSFTDNAAASPQTVALSGTSVAAPVVQVLPLAWTFSTQSAGTSSAAKQFNISNAGSGTVSVNVAISGPNAADFPETDNCAGAKGVAAGSTCSANVSFNPTVLAPPQSARTASMTISYGTGSPLTVPLSGTATQPEVSFNLSSINFGNQLSGTSGPSQSIQASSSGTGALAFTKIAITGSNPSDFVESDTCVGPVGSPISVPPGGTCAVQVTFQPRAPVACGTAAGARSATLTLTDNAPGSPHSFSLGGTETDFCLIPQAGTAPGTISAGVPASYVVASYPAASPNGFSGAVAFACTGFPAGGSCSVTPASMTVAAGSSSPFQVNVTAAASALFSPLSNWRISFPSGDAWGLLAICIGFTIWLASIRFGNATGSLAWPLRRSICAYALVAMFVVGMAACGGGTSAPDPPPASPQTYTLALTGTSSCPAASTCSTAPARIVQLTLTVP